MDDRYERHQKLKAIFNDTLVKISSSKTLSDAVNEARHSSKFYDYADYEKYESKGYDTKITVTAERSFEAAKRLLAEDGGRVAVLNFANCSTAGGGVRGGSGAQEECLCRCSTLYPVIAQERFFHLYYDPNRARWDPRATDALIYSPDIIVFKSDISYPELLPENEWYKVDIITCAAPTLRHGVVIHDDRSDTDIELTPEVQYDIHLSRAKHIFNVAFANGAEKLVLGAFGCGAFRNDPKKVSQAFKDALKEYEGCFKEIVFAIYHQPEEVNNYNSFKETFDN